jgi:predicted Zn-dependent protease
MRQNKVDDALKTIRAGLEQQSKNFALRLSLAGILELKKDYERAIAEYDSLLKDQPGSMIVANNLASLLTDHRSDPASWIGRKRWFCSLKILKCRSLRIRWAG